SGHQLLRRIDSGRIGPVVERLTGLIEHDCVLTLSWAGRKAATGLEFLHRRDGRWYRPVIARRGDTVTVETETAAGDPAVRLLLAAVLTQVLKTGTRRCATRAPAASAGSPSTSAQTPAVPHWAASSPMSAIWPSTRLSAISTSRPC